MKTSCHWIIALWIALLSPALGLAQTRYYVNPTTGNASYNGLSATVGTFPTGPKATVQQAVDAAVSNDTIVLAAATYAQNVLINAKNVVFNSSGTATVDSVSYTGGAKPAVKISYTYSTLTINGSFVANTNWTFNTGWSYNSGSQRADRTSNSGVLPLQCNTVLTAGRTYRLTYTVNRSSFQGGIQPMVGGTLGTQQTASGTYQEEIRAGSTVGPAFYPVNGSIFNFAGYIDDVILESKTENVASVRFNKQYLESGSGNEIQQAVYLTTPTTGRIWLGVGTYNFTQPVYVTKACKIYGQDTLTSSNTATRRILSSSSPTHFFNVAASSVTIRGFQIKVMSAGNTNVLPGANTESVGVVVSGAVTGVLISNIHFQNNNVSALPNGVGVRAWDNNHSVQVKYCYFTPKDSSSLTSGFFTRGFWSENGGSTTEGNWFLYDGLQDLLVRFTRFAHTLRYNHIRGYGMEINTLGAAVNITGNVFTQPSGQPAVAYGGLIGKGVSGSNTYTITGNRFENYSTPALENYGQSNMTISGNTFVAPTSGDFTHIYASTCNNPTTCSAYGNVNSLVIKGNSFQTGASGQGTAIQLIRASASNTIGAVTVGTTGEENTFPSALRNWILLDTTSGQPVTAIVTATENYFGVTSGTAKPAAFTAQDFLDAENKITHYLDCGSAGLVTLKANTYAITNTGNCRYPQRGITVLTNGGTLILSSASPTYPAASITGKGITIYGYPSKAKMTQLTVDATGFTQDLRNSLSLTSNLTLTNGLIKSSTADTLFLTPTAPTSLTYSSGRIISHFSRGVVGGNSYLFPIGYDTSGRQTTIDILNVFSGLSSLTAKAYALNPNTQPSPSSFAQYTQGQMVYAMLPTAEYLTVNPNKGSADWNVSIQYPILSGYDGFLLATRHTASTVWQIEGDDNFPTPQGNNQFATGELKRSNLSGFSDLTIAGGLNNILPVKVDAFDLLGKADGTVWAQWHVLEERDLASYTLTRTLYGVDTALLTVKADGRPAPKWYYTQVGYGPAGDLRIDLRSHDLDGKTDFIGTRILEGTSEILHDITLYPNPARGRFTVSSSTYTGYTILDATGRAVLSGNLEKNSAQVGPLPRGLYSVVVYSPSGTATRRLVIE